ncbi:MAG: ribonuclease Y [candidate division WOR-3 bacterium]
MGWQQQPYIWIPLVVGLALLGSLLGYLISRRLAKSGLADSDAQAQNILAEARARALEYQRKAEEKAKADWDLERQKFELETANRRKEWERAQRRLTDREISLEKRASVLAQKESDLLRRERELVSREKTSKAKSERLDQLITQQNEKLEKIAGLTAEEARRELMRNLEYRARLEAAQLIKDIREQAKAQAESQAREILAAAIQRCAMSHAAETTVSVVNLPSDELKGRIIGREGRNIRAFETLTGVEVMIDDTPGAIIISGFDPVRREIAKLAMEKLIADGRIHPARIEELVSKTKTEMDDIIRATGEGVVLELGIVGLHNDLIQALGRLRYRTSYGQNVLLHSREVAHLAALMAQELDLSPAIARRAGVLHDIGKAADQTLEGPHAAVGAEMARRGGEDEVVVNAIASHHEETGYASPYAFLIAAADSISGSRPGARRESFDAYIRRVESLENIAGSFDGVAKAYAIQAGREVRVLVEPDALDDAGARDLAGRIAARIQAELKYPGQIKVMVVREVRAVDYAR